VLIQCHIKVIHVVHVCTQGFTFHPNAWHSDIVFTKLLLYQHVHVVLGRIKAPISIQVILSRVKVQGHRQNVQNPCVHSKSTESNSDPNSESVYAKICFVVFKTRRQNHVCIVNLIFQKIKFTMQTWFWRLHCKLDISEN